jgi:hypothetical protein
MAVPIQHIQREVLISYKIASADMRFIEVGEREVYLQFDPQSGPIICAAMPGSQPGCEIDLSEILLEAALAAEDRDNDIESDGLASLFGIRLGRVLAARLCKDGDTTDIITDAFACIFNSMRVEYTLQYTNELISFRLSRSPLQDAAMRLGSTRGLGSARRVFYALCKTMLRIMAPNWTLKKSPDCASELSLNLVELHQESDFYHSIKSTN